MYLDQEQHTGWCTLGTLEVETEARGRVHLGQGRCTEHWEGRIQRLDGIDPASHGQDLSPTRRTKLTHFVFNTFT